MKRDITLIRLILQALEGDTGASKEADEKYTLAVRTYNIALMIDAGLIIGVTHDDVDGNPIDGYHVSRMTWAGHDFLDAMRDDTIWKMALEKVVKPGASWTFDLLKEWAKREIQQRLGLPGN